MNVAVEVVPIVDVPRSDGPLTEVARQPALDRPAAGRSWPVKLFAGIASAVEWIFGFAAITVGLAILASYPLVQFLSLGYLLEVTGRITRTGRLRDGFVGIRKAARLGSITFGSFLVLVPLWYFVEPMAQNAAWIAPESQIARRWSTAAAILSVVLGLHIVGACWRGGKLRHFLWPRPILTLRSIFRRGSYTLARDAVWNFVTSLRLTHYFWMGVRGFIGGLIWLIVPISLLAAGTKAPAVGLLGGFLLVVVLLYLPFVQARFAAENRFRAMFQIAPVREWFRRSPWFFLVSLAVTLSFALPLYLLKIEMVPREAQWLPSLLFVAFILPARLLTGWACGRAAHRQRRAWWISRQIVRLAMLPLAAMYVFIVFFTQFTSWHGIGSLYEQHAFLVPVPFLGR